MTTCDCSTLHWKTVSSNSSHHPVARRHGSRITDQVTTSTTCTGPKVCGVTREENSVGKSAVWSHSQDFYTHSTRLASL